MIVHVQPRTYLRHIHTHTHTLYIMLINRWGCEDALYIMIIIIIRVGTDIIYIPVTV